MNRAVNDAKLDVAGFTYDPSTGFIFKNGRRRDVVGSKGYRMVTAGRLHVKAHRLAWRLYYGRWPTMDLDHRNQVKSDNRIENLRLATHGQNITNAPARKNCKSGERGVYWDTCVKKWRVNVLRDGKPFHSTASHKISAILAARLIRRELHGEFAG